MTASGFWPVFLFGIFGGFLGELIKWYRIRESKDLPHYVTSVFYWSITVLVIISSGVLAVLYGTETKNAIQVVNIGITSPLLVQTLAQASVGKRPKNNHESYAAGDMQDMYKKITKRKIINFLGGIDA
jgi:H+/Cl- antiporter ClcA